MPQGNNEKVQVLLVGTTYLGQASTDLTTNICRRLRELTGDMTARLKAIIVAAGSSN